MNKIVRYLSNFLIVGYLATIYFAGVPESNTLNSRLKKKATTVAFALGIWPSWSMFAPNPIKFDTKSFVEIKHKNGEVKLYDVEIELEGVLATFRRARWMKYSQDNLRNPNQKGLLAPAIRYHYQKYNNLNNPITSIVIKRKWWDVPLFTENVPLIPLTSAHARKESTEILFTEKFEI
jgi:hypothetical protein